MSHLEAALSAATVLLTAVCAYLAYRQYAALRGYRQPPVTVYGTREEITAHFPEILARAARGDAVFGQCRLGAGYPPQFYEALTAAAGRGVKLQALVPDKPDTAQLRERLAGLDPNRVSVRVTDGAYSASLLGIRGREVLVTSHQADKIVGVLFEDPLLCRYMELAYDAVWDRSRPA